LVKMRTYPCKRTFQQLALVYAAQYAMQKAFRKGNNKEVSARAAKGPRQGSRREGENDTEVVSACAAKGSKKGS